MKVDLPAFGSPSNPISASTFNSSLSLRCSPGSPGVALRGVRFVLDLKLTLPRPPLPPRASKAICSCTARSATVSPVPEFMITVPAGTRSTTSSAPFPLHWAPWPRSPSRAVTAREAFCDKGFEVSGGDGVDAPGAAAVRAIGPSARHVLFAPEANDAVAAIAGVDLDARFVDEFHGARGNKKALPRG